MILFNFLYITLKQNYLHSIHFHSFLFLYFKTSNQGYLIPPHSILFNSFPLLKYIPFHFISFHSLMIIPFHSFINSQTKHLKESSIHHPHSTSRRNHLSSLQTPKSKACKQLHYAINQNVIIPKT